MKLEKNDEDCFLWSISAFLHPCENSHPSKVRNYIQHFNELNFEGYDYTNGFNCSDNQKFEKLNILSINIFELNFYQDKNR